ncbi:MAG: UDP-3-O-[3-hydroxymyristoyl] N-acetylglucosamine deacetylase [Spirochaetes bacterium]|nr:UDP-3-O-[3-hydroxymyristoyl] N-acetylglucosamine deacetylase [Spirochaetota bacterium]
MKNDRSVRLFFQSTIQQSVKLGGTGLHSGTETTVTLLPAPVDTGIVFIPDMCDMNSGVTAHFDNLRDTRNAITIGSNGYDIKTIEHFMATFYAYGITNLYVVVKGYEMPILDGSSLQIVEAIEGARIQEQNAFYDTFYLPYPVWVEENGSYLIALPSTAFKITYTIDFTSKSSAIGTQTAHFVVNRDTYKNSIAPARTFGFYEDLDALRANSLALGGTIDNALLYTKEGLVNNDLRFDNECVRHKILDLIGDLSLTGQSIAAHFIAYKSGHSMDMKLVKKLDMVIKRNRSTRKLPRKILSRRKVQFERFKRKMNI